MNSGSCSSKEWSSLDELWSSLNKKTTYVVLRNFETLKDEVLSSEHPDIDFLCRDRNEFLAVAHSVSRSMNNDDPAHRTIMVCKKIVNIDIRCVGDGYLDTQWEEDILRTRELSEDGFYIPSQRNHFYSLLYHVLIQKKTVADEYRLRLTKMGQSVNILADDIVKIDTLQNFMRDKGYYFTYPENPNTIANFKNVDKSLIKSDIAKYIKRSYVSFHNGIVKLLKQYGRKN